MCVCCWARRLIAWFNFLKPYTFSKISFPPSSAGIGYTRKLLDLQTDGSYSKAYTPHCNHYFHSGRSTASTPMCIYYMWIKAVPGITSHTPSEMLIKAIIYIHMHATDGLNLTSSLMLFVLITVKLDNKNT